MEIGNICIKSGHAFTIFTEDGSFSGWFPYKGLIRTYSDLQKISLDILFFSQLDHLEYALVTKAQRKAFYQINPNVSIKKVLKHKEIEILANSTGIKEAIFRKYKKEVFPAFGGINLSLFNYLEPKKKNPDDPFVVMVYGRISKPKKGTMQVVQACEYLYKKGRNIRLLLFDTPTDEKAEKAIKCFQTKVPYDFVLNHPVNENEQLFHKADVFVSAETSGGWSNTSAEAMACGTPIIGTNVGTQDFLFHLETGYLLPKGRRRHIVKGIEFLINDYDKRKEFSIAGRKRIEVFGWGNLTNSILSHLASSKM